MDLNTSVNGLYFIFADITKDSGCCSESLTDLGGTPGETAVSDNK